MFRNPHRLPSGYFIFFLLLLPLMPPHAARAGDGDQVWAFGTGERVFSSPAIAADGTVYVGSHDNHLYAIDPDGSEKWSFTAGGAVQSPPAIGDDGTIYVGSNDHNLYAVEGSSGGLADSDWPMYHHDLRHTGRAVSAAPTVSADLTCLPATGTVPFTVTMTATLSNECADCVRRIAARVDVSLDNGMHYSNYRAGYTNVQPNASKVFSWQLTLNNGTYIGTNDAVLIVEDVTPSPYNQPPYLPADNTDTSYCTVVGISP